MNKSSSLPDFGGRAVRPLGQENFQLHGRGCIVFAIENLRSANLPIAVAEVGAILGIVGIPESAVLGKQNRTTSVAAIP